MEAPRDRIQPAEHVRILGKLKEQIEADSNALAMWVFGSVAKGNYHQGSDIDLGIVYNDFSPHYEFSTDFVDDIKVGFSRWSEEKLKHNAAHVPYRMYVFAHATMLFDRIGARQLQQNILDYLR